MRDISYPVDMAQMHGSKDDSAIPDRFFSSAPASRCNSWKNKRGGSARRDKKRAHNMARSNSVSLPDCSDTNSRLSDSLSKQKCHLCMVRSFKTTSKGIIDSGSFSKSLSSNSLLSSGSLNTSHGSGDFYSRSFSIEQQRENSLDSSDESEKYQSSFSMPSYFRTLVLGAPGVGKTSLIQQLTRCDPSSDDEEPRFTETGAIVSVQLDSQESTMEFISSSDLDDLECYKADAYILMYAVTEPKSFTHAATLLNYLRQDLGTDRTIFLVANKCDLARQRLVPAIEARKFAVNNECNFLETSTALSVNMDELLVGILCSIKKQLTPLQDSEQKKNFQHKSMSMERRPRSPKRALSAISNFLKSACRRDSRRRDVTPIPQLV
ncbi:GTP-binding protein REM 1 [Biomphalaria pfeifferi]|uniref:GTP-binding protein REM 1 n=1 Tax=Biomphalaria pfeifferi TaxID=112525 RepID=A0AAD8BXT8_BIOPF|nr:GTP-binding protein REM 1 [Biomphalaria pfeifferi]